MTKKRPRAKFCFANLNLLLLIRSRCRRRWCLSSLMAKNRRWSVLTNTLLTFSSLRPVNTVQEVMAVVYYGMKRRHEDATMVHAHSSRSHLIVQLTIYTVTNNASTSSTSDAAPSPPGTPTRSRRTLPTPSAGHSSRSQSPAPKSKSASVRRSR